MPVQEAIQKLRQELGENITLVAVSKTKPNEDILSAYEIGHLDFGENKVQDLVSKWETLPKDIQWHFIGHLQTNKVKYIAPFVHLIHGVDSMKLLKEINKRAASNNRIIDCLIQVSIADEETKFGFDQNEVLPLFENETLKEYTNINIRGFMGMATNTKDLDQVREEFRGLKNLFDKVSGKIGKSDFNILSMGMTGDYKIAIEEGSNMVRIGSLIFGARY